WSSDVCSSDLQAERQARERAQDEQRRADAAPASEQQTQARETQDAQSSSPSGESVTQSAAENAPAPMKEPAMELDQAARGARRREALGGGDPNSVPRAVADDSKRPARIAAELAMAKVTRAIYSEERRGGEG